jgi:hypothetical protein
MEILELNSSYFNENKLHFQKYFEEYPYEIFYFRNLRLEETDEVYKRTINDFLLTKLSQKINDLTQKIWLIQENNGTILSVFGLKHNQLHSTTYAKNIFTLIPFYNFTLKANEAFEVFYQFLQTLLNDNPWKKKIHHIKIKIEASDHQNIALFANKGFKYYGTSLKVQYNHKERGNVFENFYLTSLKKLYETYLVEYYNKNDSETRNQLLELVNQHKKSEHFYNYNQEFNEEKTQKLFRDWFAELIAEEKTKVSIVKRKSTKEIVGFKCYKGPINLLGKKILVRELTVITETERGKGLAGLLYHHCIINERDKLENDFFIEGTLMSDNYQNLKLNFKTGFIVAGTNCFLKQDYYTI